MAGAMTFEANLVPSGRHTGLRLSTERERAFALAEKHTRLVGILRKVLPVLAVVVIAAYFISTHLSITVGDMTASISGIEIADGNLRMVNPKLKGADKNNGEYVLSADYADQDVKNPKIVKLHAIKADLANPSGGWSRMNATRGVFNTQQERLVMQDKITIATSSGVQGELTHATLDMKTQTLRSHRPVFFDLPNGKVKARAMTLRSSASELTFRGKVHVHLVKPPKEEGAKPDQTKPAAPAPEAVAPAPEATAAAPEAAAPTLEAVTAPRASGAPRESALPELPPMPQ
ncbi:MAG: LPS export ABC transporter periplasmic protein LptC [Phycisphaeraceae bacterium]